MRLLLASGAATRRVTILGVTFKENVPDIRNSRVFDIVGELTRFGVDVEIADPLARTEEVRGACGLGLTPLDGLAPADAVIVAVPHLAIVEEGWPLVCRILKDGRGIVLDVKGCLDRSLRPEDIVLWRM